MKYTKHYKHESKESIVKEALEHAPKLDGKMPKMHKVPSVKLKVK
jgi:hypothetical protein